MQKLFRSLLVLAYLSMQVSYLPEQFQNYLIELEAVSETDANSINEGKKHRQSKESNCRTTYGFPTKIFVSARQSCE
jgi:hypothetical protein